MDNFFEIGTYKFDLSKLADLKREDIEKLNNKKLLAIFDTINTNGDDTVDTNELSVFVEKVNKYDKSNDSKISEKEYKKFLKSTKEFSDTNMQIGIDDIGELFSVSLANYEQKAQVDAELQTKIAMYFNNLDSINREDEIKNNTISFIEEEYRNN